MTNLRGIEQLIADSVTAGQTSLFIAQSADPTELAPRSVRRPALAAHWTIDQASGRLVCTWRAERA